MINTTIYIAAALFNYYNVITLLYIITILLLHIITKL